MENNINFDDLASVHQAIKNIDEIKDELLDNNSVQQAFFENIANALDGIDKEKYLLIKKEDCFKVTQIIRENLINLLNTLYKEINEDINVTGGIVTDNYIERVCNVQTQIDGGEDGVD